MKQFEVGQKYVYTFLSDGNYEICDVYECVKRTEKTVTFKDRNGELHKRLLKDNDRDGEYVRIGCVYLHANTIYDPEAYLAPMYI